MTPTRRALLGATLAGPALASPALAQPAWPNRSIRLIVGFTPAGTTDIAARIVAERLGQRLGQQVIVENRPGAGGNLGGEVVAKADPDGYSLLMQTVSAGAINYALYGSRMPYRPEDFTPIAMVIRVPNVIFVTNALPVRTLRELVDYVKARPGQLNIGSSGVGTSLHMTGELLKQAAGIDLTHVPFRGAGPMMQEVIAGRIEVAVDNLPSAIGHIRDGRFRALAVTTATRSPALPDCPTTAEAGFPAVEAIAWFGVMGPARLPAPIVQRLNADINASLREPETARRMADLGGLPPDDRDSPADFAAFSTAEIAKWGEVVRRSGATIE